MRRGLGRSPLRRGPVTGLPTDAEIEAARSPAGGWRRQQLAEWGVSWPPPRGWRKELRARRAALKLYASPEGVSAIAARHGSGCPCDSCLAASGDRLAWSWLQEID